MGFKEHLSDLKYLMSKDNTNGNRGAFIMLAVVWCLMIFLIIFTPLVWLLPIFRGANLIFKVIITFGAVITTLFGIVAWISVTKSE